MTRMATNMVSQVKPTTLAPSDFHLRVSTLDFFMGLDSQGH